METQRLSLSIPSGNESRMFIDARQVDSGTRMFADICVIGGGAAGISVALQFLGERRSVILLESGGIKFDIVTQALYEGEIAPHCQHSPLDTYRQRRFGGTTAIWGGRCVPFDPIDFERRPWMPDSGWPISYGDLEPYYGHANRICEAGAYAYTDDQAFPEGMPPLIEGFTSQKVTTNTLERFSRPTDFGSTYRQRLAATQNVRVLLWANCTGLEVRADGAAVERATVVTLTGRRFEIAASVFVLATGGLETPRLLLASREVQPKGLGNGHGLVGRFYMAHLSGVAGILIPHGRPVQHGYARDSEGIYCRRRLRLADKTAREFGVGNIVARLHHPVIGDPMHGSGVLSALYLASRLFSYEYGMRLRAGAEAGWAARWHHLRNIASDPFGVAGFAAKMVWSHVLARRKYPTLVVAPRSGSFTIDFHAEQQPNPESRVQLIEARDATGLPMARVNWRHTDLDVRTVSAFLGILAEELARSGCGKLVVEPGEVEAALERDGPVGGHHIGTARMGASEKRGVVDPNCRVYGLGNLFVAGSAVFPTSGQANPTLTIVALAIRLADHLKRQWAPQDLGMGSCALRNAEAQL